MDLKNIRLIGVDLDGTLLHDDKALSARTIDAIVSASKKGIEVVPITGRPYAGIPDSLKNMPEIKHIIYSNGSEIVENGQSLFSFSLNNKEAREIIKIVKSHNCMMEIFVDGWGYVEPYVDKVFHSVFTEDSPIGSYVFGSRKVVDDLDEFLQNGKGVDEVFCISDSRENRDKLATEFENYEGITCWCLEDVYFEITNSGTDKGEALSALCNHLGIDLADTIAFGDGENDLPFLQKAGVAVAMDNACDAVKAKADIITLSNNDDGVAYIIEQI